MLCLVLALMLHKNFLPRLKDHLLARLRNIAYSGDEHDFSDEDRNSVLITDNKIFEHSILRINYTTYDLRREQDTINPRTRADIMVLSHEDDRTHPYWYARVIRIFHVNVEYREHPAALRTPPTRLDVLFVRWFCRDSSPAGWAAKRLQRLEFFDHESLPDAFGFLDPDSVVRGVHLIPAFAHSPTDELLGPTFARRKGDSCGDDSDWRFYYVNM